MVPRRLIGFEKDQLKKHLLRLQGEDRRLRFGAVVSDYIIEKYVDDTIGDVWFGCFDDELISACHVSVSNNEAELGCSVDKDYRGAGLAQIMFERAVTHIRSLGIETVYMHCLTENDAMKHIARKNDMTVVSSYGETDATVKVEPPTPITKFRDAYLDRLALYDMLVKNNMKLFKNTFWVNHIPK
jgi:RimJ/RimL family protein N-acetyltransferase